MPRDDKKSPEVEIADHPDGVELQSGAPEPPVVARMVVEIRSDGKTTIARGAMEDAISGEKVAIEARGTSPLALALGLARSMGRGRAFARSAVRALLPGRKKR